MIIDGIKNYIKIPASCLQDYQDGDVLKIKLSKKNCIDRVFEASSKVVCGCNVLLDFHIVNCLEQTGSHNIEVLNESDNIIFQKVVTVYDSKN